MEEKWPKIWDIGAKTAPIFFAKLPYTIIDRNDDYKHGNSVIATNRPEYEKSYYGLFKE